MKIMWVKKKRCEKSARNTEMMVNSLQKHFREIGIRKVYQRKVYQKDIWIIQGTFTNGTLRIRWITSRAMKNRWALFCDREGASPGTSLIFRIFTNHSTRCLPFEKRRGKCRARTPGVGTPRQRRDTYSYLLLRNISGASVKTYTHGGFLRELRFSALPRIPPCRRGDIESVSSFWWTRVFLPKPESRKRMGNREIGRQEREGIRRLSRWNLVLLFHLSENWNDSAGSTLCRPSLSCQNLQ